MSDNILEITDFCFQGFDFFVLVWVLQSVRVRVEICICFDSLSGVFEADVVVDGVLDDVLFVAPDWAFIVPCRMGLFAADAFRFIGAYFVVQFSAVTANFVASTGRFFMTISMTFLAFHGVWVVWINWYTFVADFYVCWNFGLFECDYEKTSINSSFGGFFFICVVDSFLEYSGYLGYS